MAPISDKFISPSAPFGLGGMSKMFKRQRYQFGSVERKARKKGPDVWALRYREHLLDGTNCHKSLIVGTVAQHATESQARKAAQTLLLRINADKPSAGAVTFGAVIDRYLAEELPGRHSTARGYRSWLQNHITPKWGEYSLEQIKPLAVEQWLKGLDLAPKSKGHLKNQMRIVFNCAMRWELLPYQTNPMSFVRVKDVSKRVRQPAVLTIEQFRQLLEHIPEPYRTMCVVAGCLGLRISEVLGLQWRDFDWDTRQLQIRRSWVCGHVGEPKTENSRRPMPVDPALEKILRDHRRRLPSSLQSEWVFPSKRTGMPAHPWSAQRRWLLRAGEKVGTMRLGWHAFRHTYSTLLNEHGTDVKVQQELLRHADIRTTMNVYTRAVPERLRKANSKLVRLLLPTGT
jgi:integrase